MTKMVIFKAICLLLAAAVTDCRDISKLVATVNPDGSYAFASGSNPKFVLAGSEAFLQADGMFYINNIGTLKLTSSKQITGRDSTGTYNGTVFTFEGGETKMVNQILNYNDGEFIRFTQSYPGGVKHSNVSDDGGVLSSFPSFQLGCLDGNIGYLSMFDNFCGSDFQIGNFSDPDGVRSDLRGGPIVLFDGFGNTMIVSAYSEFMAHNYVFNTTSKKLHYGIMGGVTEVPVDYQIDTILYHSIRGINRAIENWGRVLTTRYKKPPHRNNDFTIEYLGYWTDNGAFYYYNTEKGKTYQQTILDVVDYAKQTKIPYRYIQYDSWWYYKGIDDGVKNWTARPDVFPNGSNYIFDLTGLPVSAHNRYWASDTTYAAKNGGKYNFIVEETKAIPQDTTFWEDLMREAKQWGLISYEQDWLDREFELMKVTHTNISVGRNWLMEMGRGAYNHDITIQYCMALSRHMLQSLEIPAVTQIRTSDDYQPGNGQWRVGVPSMFAHAINLAPYKDTFWTTSVQPGSPYPHGEPNPELEVAIATFTTGPVGPSDKIGYTNVDLLMKCCNEDGLILKPSRAITASDETIAKHALRSCHPNAANDDAEVYSTYSDVTMYGDNGPIILRNGIVVVTDLTTANYTVPTSTMYLNDVDSWTYFMAYQGHPSQDSKFYKMDKTTRLKIPKCGQKDFQLWHAAPVITFPDGSEMAIIGERSKWVPVSHKRIHNIEQKGGNLLIDIFGAPNEVVSMEFLTNITNGSGDLKTIKCVIPDSGVAMLSVNAGKCIPK